MVSIAAFQAVDPGSIPGRRRIFSLRHFVFSKFVSAKIKALLHLLFNYVRKDQCYLAKLLNSFCK